MCFTEVKETYVLYKVCFSWEITSFKLFPHTHLLKKQCLTVEPRLALNFPLLLLLFSGY